MCAYCRKAGACNSGDDGVNAKTILLSEFFKGLNFATLSLKMSFDHHLFEKASLLFGRKVSSKKTVLMVHDIVENRVSIFWGTDLFDSDGEPLDVHLRPLYRITTLEQFTRAKMMTSFTSDNKDQ